MRGELVTVIYRDVESSDPYGGPIVTERREDVDNVLVAPGALADLGEDRPEGADVRYTLYFPKAFTGQLEGSKVEVRGEAWEVIGHPDRFSPCPTEWDMVCEVGGTHG